MTDPGSPDPLPGAPDPGIPGPGPSDPDPGPPTADLDVHPGAGSADVALLERVEAELSGVDAALTRLDGGRYGTCRVCTGLVDDARLAADPLIETCADHEIESGPRRPA